MEQQQPHQVLSPSSSGRRSTSFSNSPEFEFWMLRNPSFPQSNILPADQLFSGGVLLPLHLLPPPNSDHPPHLNPQPSNPQTVNPNQDKDPQPQQAPEPDPGPDLSSPTSLATTLTPSKRWTDIFKKSDRKSSNKSKNYEDKEKDKKKERRGGGGNGSSSAELNINIWPFSRSRSAGNGGNRPRVVTGSAAARKVSSAPCSRSNSAGESKSRKWPASPARGGVHLGRSSPVWQVRRGGGSVARGSEPCVHVPAVHNFKSGIRKEGSESRHGKTPLDAGGGARAKVLNLKGPMCIGYRNHLSCKSDLNSSVVVSANDCDTDVAGHNGGVGSCNGGRGGNMFNLRSLFSKKVF